MWKSSIIAAALAFAAFLLVSFGHDKALAQSAGLTVAAVDLDIAPGQIDAYIAAVKENGIRGQRAGLPRVQHLGL